MATIHSDSPDMCRAAGGAGITEDALCEEAGIVVDLSDGDRAK